MKIVVDQNIPGIAQTFSQQGEVVAIDGRQLTARQLSRMGSVDALIVRSVTRVDANLLSDSAVRFVGTCTIGCDHLDLEWLAQQGISWASAPGCNADAAAQYTLTMMLLACHRLGKLLEDCSVGIVGLGNVGSRVARLLSIYGVEQIQACDPPLAAAGQTGLASMDRIARCDIITLHVPLHSQAPYPTLDLVGADFLSQLKPGAVLVNTSRGRVVQGQALQDWLTSGQGFAALDVWPDEPVIAPELLCHTTVATPHVAGYSRDGKLRGTLMVYQQFCQWSGIDAPCPDLLSSLPAQDLMVARQHSLSEVIRSACPVERDDTALRKSTACELEQQADSFDELRRNYPERRDFSGWRLAGTMSEGQARTLRALGFH